MKLPSPRNCDGKFVKNVAKKHICTYCDAEMQPHYWSDGSNCKKCGKPHYQLYWECPAPRTIFDILLGFLTDNGHSKVRGGYVHI